MPSWSCSRTRFSGEPVPALFSNVGTCFARSLCATRTLRVMPIVFGSPPSTTTASEPFGIFTRLGARSRHLPATRPRQTSGLRSMCPSPEMTLYSRAMMWTFLFRGVDRSFPRPPPEREEGASHGVLNGFALFICGRRQRRELVEDALHIFFVQLDVVGAEPIGRAQG